MSFNPMAWLRSLVGDGKVLKRSGNSFVGAAVAATDAANTYTGAQTLAPTAATSGTRTALTITTPADTGITTTAEQTDVHYNGSSTRTWATGTVAAQRFWRLRAPTIAAAGASTFTYAALVYIEGAPIAGTNATITTSYALFVDSGRVRFDGAVVQNDYPVIQSTSVLTASPTVNTPCGVVQVDSGQTAVTVTATAVTANSLIFAQIRNATTNAVSVLRVVPGSGSFTITLSGDPGASHAQVAFQVVQPGAGT